MVAADDRQARSIDGNLGYLFRVAYQVFRDRLAHALAVHELSVPQYSALSAFDLRGEMTSAELARLLLITPQSANSTVHQLLGRSLLSQAVPATGRAVALTLTTAGRRLLDEATRVVREAERDAMATTTAAEQRLIKRWLSDLAADQ